MGTRQGSKGREENSLFLRFYLLKPPEGAGAEKPQWGLRRLQSKQQLWRGAPALPPQQLVTLGYGNVPKCSLRPGTLQGEPGLRGARGSSACSLCRMGLPTCTFVHPTQHHRSGSFISGRGAVAGLGQRGGVPTSAPLASEQPPASPSPAQHRAHAGAW